MTAKTKMPQHHDASSHEGRHKAKPAPAAGIKDIECPARRHQQLLISSRVTKTESTISILSSTTSRRQRQHSHSHGRRCCTINNILYAVFIALLFVWILLQHLIAHSFRNTTQNISPDFISSLLHNMTIDGDQHHHQQHQQQNATPTPIPASSSNLLQDRQSSSSSWLTRTKYFQKAIDSSFEMIDVDKSGDVSLEELYAGLLLIHLNMAVYVGPPACRVRSSHASSPFVFVFPSSFMSFWLACMHPCVHHHIQAGE